MSKQEYILLKFINSIGKVRGRKRLQKLLFLMKYKGVPLENRFFMHYYGPYSADLALQIDSLVSKGLLDEKVFSCEHNYELSSRGKDLLNEIEKGIGKTIVDDNFVQAFREYSGYNVSDLEKASTILFWVNWGKSLKDALEVTRIQKGTISDKTKSLTRNIYCSR